MFACVCVSECKVVRIKEETERTPKHWWLTSKLALKHISLSLFLATFTLWALLCRQIVFSFSWHLEGEKTRAQTVARMTDYNRPPPPLLKVQLVIRIKTNELDQMKSGTKTWTPHNNLHRAQSSAKSSCLYWAGWHTKRLTIADSASMILFCL